MKKYYRETQPVLLDTNALLMPFQFKIDLENELGRVLGRFEILVPSTVVRELKKISRKDSRARAALELSKRYRVIEARGKVDRSILNLAIKAKAAVVTNDRRLRQELRKLELPVIFLRARTHLELEGVLF